VQLRPRDLPVEQLQLPVPLWGILFPGSYTLTNLLPFIACFLVMLSQIPSATEMMTLTGMATEVAVLDEL
jgi:hypothetical protein